MQHTAAFVSILIRDYKTVFGPFCESSNSFRLAGRLQPDILKTTSAIFPLELLATLSPTKPHWFPSRVLMRHVEPSRAEPSRTTPAMDLLQSRAKLRLPSRLLLSRKCNQLVTTNPFPPKIKTQLMSVQETWETVCMFSSQYFSLKISLVSLILFVLSNICCVLLSESCLVTAGGKTFPENAASQLTLLNV